MWHPLRWVGAAVIAMVVVNRKVRRLGYPVVQTYATRGRDRAGVVVRSPPLATLPCKMPARRLAGKVHRGEIGG